MRKFSMLATSAAPAVIGLALVASPAFAQGAPADDDKEPAIVVTGSRLAQPNLESASPVTVIGAEEIKATGTTRVEDLVNSLPQVFAGQGGNLSNGATGTATLDLRGLGSERTLVLVNGRRVVPGDPSSSAADINIIPGAMVKRIDVLTGGASAVYGADAVSGVVNFIMDTTFEGFRLDGQYSLYDHNNRNNPQYVNQLNFRGFPYPSGHSVNGGTVDATFAFGAGFDDGRGHVTAYAGYRKVNQITAADRDYSSCTLTARSAVAVAANNGSLYTCGGSGTSANGTFFSNLATLQVGPNRTFIPGSTPFNFAPYNYFQRPDERYTAGMFADYEISESLHPYMEFMFMDDRTVAQIAPSGDFGNTFTINCGAPGAPTTNAPGVGNPLLSAQQRALVCQAGNLLSTADPFGGTGGVAHVFIDPTTGLPYTKGFLQPLRRNVEGGGRQDDRQHTSYRGVIGLKGDLGDAWSYDAAYQYGRTILAETYFNDFSISRLTKALDVIDDPRTPGVDPICRSVLDGSDPNCVPWDIFATGQVTPASLTYLQTPGFQRGINTEQVVNIAFTGDLGKWGMTAPWAKDGIGLAIGAEYRKETLALAVDTEFSSGDLAGQGGATLPVSGAYDVKEAFGEIRIPLVQDTLFHELTITGGFRYSDYNVSGRSFSTSTYKVEGEFSPIEDIRFRGGYNRAVRAPTLQDYFATQNVSLDGSTDPCATGVAITAAQVGCLAQGLTVGQVVVPNPANQYNGLFGGNPNLLPEVADTWTVGAVLTPRFLPGFSLSVDWFDIQIEDAIQGIGADTILANCGVTTVNAFFCGLVHRDQSGSLWRTPNGYVIDTTQNIGGASTRGIDVNAAYSHPIGDAGRLTFSFVGTWLDHLITDDGVSGVPVECAGVYGAICGTPSPTWRHQARLGFDAKNGLGASIRWRYFNSVAIDGTGTQPANLKIPSVNYFDLALSAKIGDHYKLNLGANNLLDKEPPLTGGPACPPVVCSNNVFAQVYDSVGRYIYVGVTLDF